MTGAFWILVFMILIGIVLYIGELRYRRKRENVAGEPADSARSEEGGEREESPEAGNMEEEESEQCCGLHLVCEKDSLSPMSDKIIYYDDEELDRFVGRSAESYTPEETEEFREVLMTLLPQDIAGWARSVTQRRLELPPDVRDELLMLVNEQRNMN